MTILWHEPWKPEWSIARRRCAKCISVTTGHCHGIVHYWATVSGNAPSRDNASISTLVTARLIRVPVETDTQIITDEYKYCWTKCSAFGSRAVIKGHVIDSQVSHHWQQWYWSWQQKGFVRQTLFVQVSHSTREDTRGPGRNGASVRQSSMVSCYNLL
jgi:hypothetical protein